MNEKLKPFRQPYVLCSMELSRKKYDIVGVVIYEIYGVVSPDISPVHQADLW